MERGENERGMLPIRGSVQSTNRKIKQLCYTQKSAHRFKVQTVGFFKMETIVLKYFLKKRKKLKSPGLEKGEMELRGRARVP